MEWLKLGTGEEIRVSEIAAVEKFVSRNSYTSLARIVLKSGKQIETHEQCDDLMEKIHRIENATEPSRNVHTTLSGPDSPEPRGE